MILRLILFFNIILNVNAHLKTCDDLKSTFEDSEKCCDESPNKKLDAPLEFAKRSYKPITDYESRKEGDFDFVVAGAGTGGVAAAARLALLNTVEGQDVTIGLFEAGRWLEPVTEKVSYTLSCTSNKEGNPETHNIEAWVPQNWITATDAYLKAYVRWMQDEKGAPFLLVNGAFGTYTFLDPLMLQTKIQELYALFKGDPVKYGLIENHPEITVELPGSPLWHKPGSCTYKGKLMGLMPSPWTDVNHNQLFAYTGSEDLWFHEARYQSSHDMNNEQIYPRGKTVGGSGVVNAAVHYGLTKEYLEEIADDIDDPWWASEEVANVVHASVARCDCQGDECNAPVSSSAMVVADELVDSLENSTYSDGTSSFFSEGRKKFVNQILNKDLMPNMYLYPNNPSERRCMDSFSREDRYKMNVRTRSWNKWRNHRTTPADALINVINAGVHVCWVPHPTNENILSEHVLRPEQNCNHPDGAKAKLHIYTGAYVTKYVTDSSGDVPRITGIEWVYENDQERPDQNRMEPQGSCVPQKIPGLENIIPGSLYGNGKPNTVDCVNRANTGLIAVRVNFTDGSTKFDDMDAVSAMFKASTSSNGPVAEFGTNGQGRMIGGAIPVEYGVARRNLHLESSDGVLGEDGTPFKLKNVKTASAKKTVVSALGAPQTVKTLLKSGYGSKSLSERIGIQSHADLPVGDTFTDNSENFILYEPPTEYMLKEIPEFKENSITEIQIESQYGEAEGDPTTSYLTNMTNDRGYIKPPSGFGDLLMAFDDFHKDKAGYHSNNHITGGGVPVILGARLYSLNHKQSNAFFPCIVPDWYTDPVKNPNFFVVHPYVAFTQKDSRTGFMLTLAGKLQEEGKVERAQAIMKYVGNETTPETYDLLALEFGREFMLPYYLLTVAEVSGGTDARHGNMRMTVKNAHPFEKTMWHADRGWLTLERCKEMRSQMDVLLQASRDFIGNGKEYSIDSYTKRKYSFDKFSQETLASNLPIITRSNYRKYRDEKENPILQSYTDDKSKLSDEDFCSLYSQYVSGHHIQGGAISGKPTDKWAASDSRGRLYNTQGLVLSDLSWVPRSPDGNPWVSIFSIGNIMAYNLAKDWGYDVSEFNKNYMKNVDV